MRHLRKNQKGFTAVELLFVILIIGILALVSVSFLNTSRERARDAKRLVDIRRIQTSLEFYKLEYDTYPVTEQPVQIGVEPFIQLCDETSGAFVSAAASCETVLMAPVPTDPKAGRQYLYVGAEDAYTISFETETDTELGPAGAYYAHSETINRSPDVE